MEKHYFKSGLCFRLKNNKRVMFIIFVSQMMFLFIVINRNSFPSNYNEFEYLPNVSSFKLKHCGCQRQIISSSSQAKFKSTTCGEDSYHRGDAQKVVAFSFYGKLNSSRAIAKGYYEGIVENLALMPKYYPGWTMRLYYDQYDNDTTLASLCKLACSNNLLDLCYVKQLPGTPKRDASRIFAMNWRFFPTLDPQVDALVSRDLDSRPSNREMAAVKQWIESSKAFHVMRDHPDHRTFMVGSAWGVKLHQISNESEADGNIRRQWRNSWRNGAKDSILWRKRSDWGPDQIFLNRYVWPWAKKNMMSHDAYLCKKYTGTIPFPTRRKHEENNFVASVARLKEILWIPCPKKCRPKQHADWTFC